MKVKEIMKRDVMSLKPEDNAKDALDILFKHKISGLPVIDAQGKLAGMFTEKNILAHILPSYLEKVGNFVYEVDPKAVKKKLVELSTMKVVQLMRPRQEVVTATEDMSLGQLAKDMLTQKARRVPVIDKTGKVLGIVARCDVLKALTEEAGVPIKC